jgi:DnaK suppressor protein
MSTDPRTALLERLATLVRRGSAIESHLRQEDGRLEADFADKVAFTEMDEVLESLGDAGRREVEDIRGALARLDEGSYGVCVGCGVDIPPGRLAALPSTAWCVQCATLSQAS